MKISKDVNPGLKMIAIDLGLYNFIPEKAINNAQEYLKTGDYKYMSETAKELVQELKATTTNEERLMDKYAHSIFRILEQEKNKVSLATEFYINTDFEGKIPNISAYGERNPLVPAFERATGLRLSAEDLQKVDSQVEEKLGRNQGMSY